MSIIKVDQVFLYTGLSPSGSEQFDAYQWLKTEGVDFQLMNYGDPEQQQSVFDSLNTWEGAADKHLNKFPIVHYRVVDDNYQSTIIILHGFDELRTSDLAVIYKQYR